MAYEVANFPDREITIKNERFLYFGGTAYLGLQTDKDFQEIFIKNIKKYGTNYGASRNANIRIDVYEKVENYLAEFIGSQDCLTLSSGFLTGQMLAKYFHSKNRSCFYAPATHEALHILNTENQQNHKDLSTNLEAALKNPNENPVLFLDSILLSGKNYPDFEWLHKINLDRVTLVVDDSHGLGIVGENGNGVYESLVKMNPKEILVCGSLGKGFGIQAGFIAGNTLTINELRTLEMYAAASPASPASMATLLESQEIAKTKRSVLLKNIEYFIANIAQISQFNFLPEYPCFAFGNKELNAHLEKNKIIVTSFYYPTENDELVQRIVLSAHHKKSDIKRLTACTNEYF